MINFLFFIKNYPTDAKMETPLFDRMHKIIYLKIIALMPIFDRKRPFSTRIPAVEDTPKTLKNTYLGVSKPIFLLFNRSLLNCV